MADHISIIMKKYNITVNGNLYEVVVEEAADNGTQPAAPAVQNAAPAPVSAPAPAPAAPKAAPQAQKPAAPASDGAVKVSAPMPGTIVKINVEVGKKIAAGDTLCVLEAMKMENDIPAPSAGTVASVNVSKGSSVNSGDLLITLN